MAGVEIRRGELTSPVARALFLALNEELSGRYPEVGATHFRLDPEEVAPECGAFLVAYAGERPVGCGAIRRLDATAAEIKRMYVTPEMRGSGVSGEILGALQAEARRLGVERVVLESGLRQPEALSLYLKTGFVRVPPFGEYLGSPLSVCMAKSLAPPPEGPTLATHRLVLSPLVADDAERLFEYRSHPDVRRFQTFEPRSVEDARVFIDDTLALPPIWHQLGLRLRESATLTGDIGFRPGWADPPEAEIGITVAPDHQRRGIAHEAVAGLLGHLFDTLHIDRVYASVDPRNVASTGLFERLGFRLEAHLRRVIWWKGEWADDMIYAMLRSEYRV
jgi:putative acetyltransferase